MFHASLNQDEWRSDWETALVKGVKKRIEYTENGIEVKKDFSFTDQTQPFISFQIFLPVCKYTCKHIPMYK